MYNGGPSFSFFYTINLYNFINPSPSKTYSDSSLHQLIWPNETPNGVFPRFYPFEGGDETHGKKMRDEFVEDGIVSVLSRACYETRSEQRRAFNTSLTHDLNRAEIEAIRASGEVHSKGVVPTDRFSHGKQPRLRLPQKFRKTDFFLLFPSFSLWYRIAFRSLHHSAKIMVNIYIYTILSIVPPFPL